MGTLLEAVAFILTEIMFAYLYWELGRLIFGKEFDRKNKSLPPYKKYVVVVIDIVLGCTVFLFVSVLVDRLFLNR